MFPRWTTVADELEICKDTQFASYFDNIDLNKLIEKCSSKTYVPREVGNRFL